MPVAGVVLHPDVGGLRPLFVDLARRLATRTRRGIVGANIGAIALLAASLVKSSGRVIAVEPSASMAAGLREGMREHGIPNVEIVEGVAEGGDVEMEDAETGEIVHSWPRMGCGAKPAFSKDGRILGWNEPAGYRFIDLGPLPEATP